MLLAAVATYLLSLNEVAIEHRSFFRGQKREFPATKAGDKLQTGS
jgi:hypothetical protein